LPRLQTKAVTDLKANGRQSLPPVLLNVSV
jgi:hypothetical protein